VWISLLSARGRVLQPTQRRNIKQRYRDAPVAQVIVPTLLAFAAPKTATWALRRAPRDLWALRRIGDRHSRGAPGDYSLTRLFPTRLT
jgi:hypothetical protein